MSHTGIAGLTLGGGFGRVARHWGLSLDNVAGVDIVTADGSLLHADAQENSELYRGVRGGGGNFGVVTSFQFRLHPMQREVLGGLIAFPFCQAKQVLRFYSEYGLTAPHDLYLSCGDRAAHSGLLHERGSRRLQVGCGLRRSAVSSGSQENLQFGRWTPNGAHGTFCGR